MAITFDATANGNTGATSITFSHTLGSLTNGVIVVAVSFVSLSTQTNLTGITYNGVTMTHVDGYEVNDAVTFATAIYVLATDGIVAAGAHNVVVSFDGTTDAVAGSLSFSGVDQSTPVIAGHSGANHAASGSTMSATITSAANEMLVACVSVLTGTSPTADGSQTEKWNTTSPNALTGAGDYKTASGSSETMQWTGNSLGSWSVTAISLKVASAGLFDKRYFKNQAVNRASTY